MKKKRAKLICLIILMVISAAALSASLIHRANLANEARRQEELRKAEELRQQEEEARIAAEKEAEEQEIASHVYSHRGSEGLYEHSFKAYDEAISAGSRNIEQDIVISSDGELFVSHDLNAVSMTGIDVPYSSMTAEEIDGLTTRAGYKVLRLSEVFDKYGRSINYIIELKTSDNDTLEAFETIVDEYGYKDIITVQCKETEALRVLDEKYPDMPKLFICKSEQDFYDSLEMPYVDIISVSIDRGLMTESNCVAAHDRGKLFSAWTLSLESSIRDAIDMNVDTYFTNDTPLAISLEREYGLVKRPKDNK